MTSNLRARHSQVCSIENRDISESTVVLSMEGWHVLFLPLIQNFQPLFLPTQAGMPYTSTEHHISSLHSHLWVQLYEGRALLQSDKNGKFLLFFIIRVCGSTLYVGLVRAVPPINTNFRLTFLLTWLRRLSMKTYLYKSSSLKSS